MPRFRHNWEAAGGVEIPNNTSILQLVEELAKERIARRKKSIGKSRQFTVEEIQTANPFDTNDVSVEELRASVNLEGEDPQELLQYINTTVDIELPEEHVVLFDADDDVNEQAGVTAEPKVEQQDIDPAVEDITMENEETSHSHNKIPTWRSCSVARRRTTNDGS